MRKIQKLWQYGRYRLLSLGETLSGQRLPPELRNNIKQWVYYVHLREKYAPFVKRYLSAHPKAQATGKHPKHIWWCWLQGEDKAPDLCKACLDSVRKAFPDYTITIITEENVWNLCHFPQFITDKYQKGVITRTHLSDLIRVQLLANEGGIWIDATVLCTGTPGYALEGPLFAFKEAERGNPACAASSWFLATTANESIITLTRDLLFEYWRHHAKLYHYFLFHFFFNMATEAYPDEWKQVPFYSNLPCHVLQRELFQSYHKKRADQIQSMTCIHKLTYKYKHDTDIEGTFYDHILKEGDLHG